MANHIKGSIKRIHLENFLTYKEIEFCPNAGLNIITGPNGTGKSTLLCALMLGLSGKPSIIGRAKKIGEYVRTGSVEASIEIELYGDSEKDSVIITHKFNVDNRSIWSINNERRNAKDVDDFVSTMNIQIDNLCQILPQDRLQDFAKMNPQELLRSTQVAIGEDDLSSLLDSLCEEKKNKRKITATLANNKKSVDEFEKLNAVIKEDIEILNRMKKMVEQLEICKKKKLWLEYIPLMEKVDELKREVKKCQGKITEEENHLKPYEMEIAKIAGKISSTESTLSKINEQIVDVDSKINDLCKESDSQTNAIRNHIEHFENKKNDVINQQRNIDEAELRLSKLNNDKQELQNRYKNLEVLNAEIRKLTLSLEMERNKEKKIKSNIDNITADINNINSRVQMNKNSLNELSNVKNKRLQFLQERHPHTYQAMMWLRQNTELFHGNVYEPMLLEINFTDTKFSQYLECTVPIRDLIAFTFESSDDMNLFLLHIRRQNLKLVNSVCSQPLNDTFKPSIPINHIRQHGFSVYLAETIRAPEAIVHYLCKSYKIHDIPIGNDFTFLHSENVPDQVTHFFTERHKFTRTRSRYSSAKSTNMMEVRPARILSNAVNENLMSELTQSISKLEIEEKQKKKILETQKLNIQTIEKTIDNCLATKQPLTNNFTQWNTLTSRIQRQLNELNRLKNSVINLVVEEEKMKTRITNSLSLKKNVESRLIEFSKQYQNLVINGEIIEIELGNLRTTIMEKRNLLSTKQIELRYFKENMEEVKVLLNNAFTSAKSKLNDAKQSCNNRMINDDDFPLKDAFRSLPEELGALMEHIAELQTRIDCSHDIDSSILKEFENREKQITKLKKDILDDDKKIQFIDIKMQRLRNKWLPPFNSKLSLINKNFGKMFSQMGCAGEVKLSQSGEDDDYDKYGISIMVKFREQDIFQQLSQFTQSGGERALATGIYIMSLQQLSKVPFRCVDEINQGMDAINERKMFEILFEITSNCDNQYFLLTPKLLPNLEYTRSTKIHIIENGPMIPKFYEWDLHKFISSKQHTKKQRVQ